MIALLARLAAADPVPAEADPELAELRQALEALLQERDRSISEVELTRRELGRVMGLLESAALLLDERQPLEARIARAEALGASADPRAVPILRAGARTGEPEIRLASATAALSLAPAGLEVARAALADPDAPKRMRLVLLQRLGEVGTDAAGELLFEVGADRGISARIRAEAVRQLQRRYPRILARHDPAPRVVDPLGGAVFVAANGAAGGLLMSSLGQWGRLADGELVGAVGGTAMGLAGGAVYAMSRPVDSGQALAYASAVGFGHACGRWVSTAALGSPEAPDGGIRQQAGAGWRALGVLGGIGIGALAIGADPEAGEVIELDLAGYLGSAIARGAAEVAVDRPPPVWSSGQQSTWGSSASTLSPSPAEQHRDAAGRRRAVASLAGGTAGLALGAALRPRWELEADDALFGGILGLQAAWLGNAVPPLVGADRLQVQGEVWLSWHAGVAGGLALSEGLSIPVGRSLSAAWGSVAGDALGAGIPLMFARRDERAVALGTIPAGVLGTVGGLLLHPRIGPTGDDAAMIGAGTSIAASQGLMVGLALRDLGAFGAPDQVAGLTLTAAGAAGLGLYGLSAVLEPRADRTAVLGGAAAWGGFYGGLVPVALIRGAAPAGSLLSASLTSAASTLGVGLWMRGERGIEPGDTVVPQLGAVTGATVGALAAGLSSADGPSTALGGVIGATLGFAAGAGIEALRPDRGSQAVRWSPRLPGVWSPSVTPRTGPDGSLGAVAGVRAVGW